MSENSLKGGINHLLSAVTNLTGTAASKTITVRELIAAGNSFAKANELDLVGKVQKLVENISHLRNNHKKITEYHKEVKKIHDHAVVKQTVEKAVTPTAKGPATKNRFKKSRRKERGTVKR